MAKQIVEFEFSIGDRVRDKNTKFEGVVTALFFIEGGVKQVRVENADHERWIMEASAEAVS